LESIAACEAPWTSKESKIIFSGNIKICSECNSILELIEKAPFQTDFVAAANGCYSKYREFLSTAPNWINESPNLECTFYFEIKKICKELSKFGGIAGISFDCQKEISDVDQLLERIKPMGEFYFKLRRASDPREIKRIRQLEMTKMKKELTSCDPDYEKRREMTFYPTMDDDSDYDYKIIRREEAELFHLVMEVGRQGKTLDGFQRERILKIAREIQLGKRLNQIDPEQLLTAGLPLTDFSYEVVDAETSR
jgi:hypothetical protein